jgi:aspartyl-tRNA(Asn)/glutamyl-tRNA(Gln) amidotransferase subunit B
MQNSADLYETVVGLEIHIQLKTESKAYCADSTRYGALPNTLVSPVSLGLPGTLPVLNEAVVQYAVSLGLALDCNIREENGFARKNYFYADLPKGYQITQDTTPICSGGKVRIKMADHSERIIELERIHIEEDAGKSIHDQDPFDTLIDLNRAGVPLLEIVSKPDIRSGEEAYAFLMEIRKLVRHLNICDGNMEEGSLRCDANISVRKLGSEIFGQKVEVKNMNSMRHVQKAIAFERSRQIELLESGGIIKSETRTFDAPNNQTLSMRSKEGAQDYRYFPEPDLPPVIISPEYIAAVKAALPPLPWQLLIKYTEVWQLGEAEALAIIENKEETAFFEAMVKEGISPKSAANWLLVQIKGWLNEKGLNIVDFPIGVGTMAALIRLINDGKISHTAAAGTLFHRLCESPDLSPETLANELNVLQVSGVNELLPIIQQVLIDLDEDVQRYKSGKIGLLGRFMGEVMKRSGGKADPKASAELLKKHLDL